MDKVYSNQDVKNTDEMPAGRPEISKMDEIEQANSLNANEELDKSYDSSSSGESNVIKVDVQEEFSQKQQNSHLSDIEEEGDAESLSENQEQIEHDHGLNNKDVADDEETLNKNQISLASNDPNSQSIKNSLKSMRTRSSYGLPRRKAFKFDDEYEYAGNLGQKKGPIEMDPPEPGSQGKRKRKSNNLIPSPFNEGLKRSMSEKVQSSQPALQAGENKGVVYNQGRWTSLEHFKFLEALKRYGKEWQKVQQHVSTRTSTQARSHAQKFFVKLDK